MHGAQGSSSSSRAQTLPAFSLSSVSCRRALGALLPVLGVEGSERRSAGEGDRAAPASPEVDMGGDRGLAGQSSVAALVRRLKVEHLVRLKDPTGDVALRSRPSRGLLLDSV